MGILDDFAEAVSDGADAVGDLVDDAVKLGEEGLDEAAKIFMEEILGIDFDSSDDGASTDGHDHDADYGDTSNELKLADPMDSILTTVDKASAESDALQWLWMDDILGTIDDLVTNPDATHVFDKVAGSIDDVVTYAQPQPSVIGVTEFAGADLTLDSLLFMNPGSSASDEPEWTNFSSSDPFAGSLEMPAYLASDSIFAPAANNQPDQTTVSLPDQPDLGFATPLEGASPSLSIGWLF